MKAQTLATCIGVAIVGLAGPALAEMMTTVECPNAKVTFDEAQTAEIKAATGEEMFGEEVCKVVGMIDASTMTEPTKVDVLLSNGNSYNVTMEAMQ